MTKLSAIIPAYKDPLLVPTIKSLLENSELGDQLEVIAGGESEITSGGYIYLITNNINGKQYIGQTISSVNQRWSQHTSDAINRGKKYPLHRAIRKYGKESFEVYILAKVRSIEGLNLLEEFFIEEMNTKTPYGYNVRSGGDSGGSLGDKTRKKLSIAHTGKKGTPHTEEFKKKLGKRSLGNKYSLGLKRSEGNRKKLSRYSRSRERGENGQFLRENE